MSNHSSLKYDCADSCGAGALTPFPGSSNDDGIGRRTFLVQNVRLAIARTDTTYDAATGILTITG